jgi:hypothetical protein
MGESGRGVIRKSERKSRKLEVLAFGGYRLLET